MTTQQVIVTARKHVANGAAMESSARLCLADAVRLADDGDLQYARARAIDSLRYSIGILHPDFDRASASK